jgi:hypothetical protein
VDWFSWTSQPEAWIALLTLTFLELVLGIDNIVLISVLTGRLPVAQRSTARRVGLALAMILRIALLFSLTWILHLEEPLFTVWGNEISWRDLTLILGGLFLVAKSTHEIHARMEEVGNPGAPKAFANFAVTIVQIGLLDIIFSIDSVITAGHGAGHRDRRPPHDAARKSVFGLRRTASYREDSGAEFPHPDRGGAHGRRARSAHPARLHLLRTWLFDLRGIREHACVARPS